MLKEKIKRNTVGDGLEYLMSCFADKNLEVDEVTIRIHNNITGKPISSKTAQRIAKIIVKENIMKNNEKAIINQKNVDETYWIEIQSEEKPSFNHRVVIFHEE